MAFITSAQNPLLQDVRQAIRRGTLTEDGFCVAEGPHLLAEALRSNCRIDAVIAVEEAEPNLPSVVRTITVPQNLFRTVSSTETSQGVIALVQPPRWTLENVFSGIPLVLVLDGVQDPGNAGTMLRAAEAFAASGVLFLKGSVNPYNPKAVRASAGSLFRIPFLAGVEEAAFLEAIRLRNLPLYAALARPERAAADCDFREAAVLVVGSEARGVSLAIQARAAAVNIPTAGVESLNAGIAAAILLYEARRQRTDRRVP